MANFHKDGAEYSGSKNGANTFRVSVNTQILLCSMQLFGWLVT
jgi:hypothetical protein